VTEVVWVAIISAAAAILGNYVGGWREARNQDRAWHRDQRKSAYAELLLGLDRFHEEADIVHFSSQRRSAPVREDPLYQQTVALARLAMIVRLVGSPQVQRSVNDLMNHCFKAVMPLVYKDPGGTGALWDNAMANDFWTQYDQFMRAARRDLGLKADFVPADRSPDG
jgi:hypothetical protein